ncbi:O-antigen ligase family protein [Stieleria mannarensis]|uniref:O-antigen ligase family protein n=1 Tax=Stieleria mannarensis TaxID=2755585 RepID=UPI0015FEC234|nr:O-antigen ligase family protein [Rhodopirellula sp. JC639]
MDRIRQSVALALVICLGAFGPVVSADLGGVLPWTKYVAALAIVVLSAVAAFSAASDRRAIGIRSFSLMWPLLVWAAYSWLQSFPLSPGWVSIFSPGAHSAYMEWGSPILPPDLQPHLIPVSIAPESTKHSAAMLTLLIPVVYSVAIACRERRNILVLMGVIGIGIAGHFVAGVVFPQVPVVGTSSGVEIASSTSFGTFLNRNNAAFLFNLGLGCGLGLIAHRVAVFRSDDINHRSPQSGDWVMLLYHCDLLVGMASVGVSAAGLMVCGSRGGVIGAFFGCLLAFGWLRSRRGIVTIPAIGLVSVVLVALAISAFPGVFETFNRFEDLDIKSGAGMHDGRIGHWPDGARAAASYFPAGSGLGTYAYAHLPYQQTSPPYWFHHADNLWLELAAEQGFPGILLAASVMAILAVAAHRLSGSVDPIDKGLGACGWYLIGTTVVTQMFDFGLILPGNLLTSAALASAIVARGFRPALMTKSGAQHLTEGLDSAPAASVVFEGGLISKPQRMFQAAFGISVVLVGAACLPQLKSDAINDTLVRSAELELSRDRVDPNAVQRIHNRIRAAILTHPTPEILIADVRLYSWIGRVQTVTAQDLGTPEEVLDAFERARRIEQRRRWYHQPSTAPKPVKAYFDAVRSSQRALAKSPLGIESRMHLVYLDFVHQDVDRSQRAIAQLATLQSQTAKQMAILAVLVGDAGNLESSATYWRKATERNVRLTHNALRYAERYPELNLSEIIAETAECQRAASRYLLEHDLEFPRLKPQVDKFLEHAIAKVACDRCQTKRQTAVCEELLGDMHFKLNQLDDSFVHYNRALQHTPTNSRLRKKLIKRLVANGRAEEASRLRDR